MKRETRKCSPKGKKILIPPTTPLRTPPLPTPRRLVSGTELKTPRPIPVRPFDTSGHKPHLALVHAMAVGFVCVYVFYGTTQLNAIAVDGISQGLPPRPPLASQLAMFAMQGFSLGVNFHHLPLFVHTSLTKVHQGLIVLCLSRSASQLKVLLNMHDP